MKNANLAQKLSGKYFQEGKAFVPDAQSFEYTPGKWADIKVTCWVVTAKTIKSVNPFPFPFPLLQVDSHIWVMSGA